MKKRRQGILYHKVKDAYEKFKETGNLQAFALDMAEAGDVRWAHHAYVVRESIEELVPDDKLTNFMHLGAVNGKRKAKR